MSLIPQEWKTGLNVATQVDNIAQQITIRIDSKNGVEGSGVIIGKQGDIYSVLTACHVVSDPYCQSGKIKDNYTLVTPDGATYRLTSKNMLLTQGLDAALLKFSSQKSYQVATLARYKIPILRKQLIFVSGFPGELKGVRKLTGGYRFHRDKGLNLAFDRLKLEVDTSGYELLYTNLTQPGMSGGPVFDSKGQVIGINTGQEGEIVSSTEQRNLGFSFGVPTIKLLAFAEQKGLDLSTLAISQQVPETLTDNDLKNVQKHPTFILENPPKDGSANSWLNYGNQLWRLKQTEQAIAAFQKAIKLNPNFGEAYYGLGLSYFQQGKIGEKDETDPKAVAAFEQAIALNPYFKQAWTQKSYALQDLGKYEEALAAIEQGIKISSDDFKLYNQRASILKDLSRYSEAKQAYTKSLENYP
ncbi:MAG TPA: hypothetical protein DCF68_17020, partial [Cyanothece sp. UBA12306]|nr:hypothetical protein [Cyanothece sp. UBA12306]